MNKMLKFVLPLALFSALSTAPAMAAYTGTPAAAQVSVKDLANQKNDAWVTLQGKLVSQVSHDKYLFSDGSGEIQVEIDQKVWNGVNAGPNDTVKITGEYDREWGMDKNKVDVKSISLVK